MDSKESIEFFVDRFYERVLADERLSPIFVDVAEVELSVHLPHIKNYWCKLLLGEKKYQRHTMSIIDSSTTSAPCSQMTFNAG